MAEMKRKCENGLKCYDQYVALAVQKWLVAYRLCCDNVPDATNIQQGYYKVKNPSRIECLTEIMGCHKTQAARHDLVSHMSTHSTLSADTLRSGLPHRKRLVLQLQNVPPDFLSIYRVFISRKIVFKQAPKALKVLKGQRNNYERRRADMPSTPLGTAIFSARSRTATRAPTGQKRGRPQKDYVGEAAEEISRYLDELDKDQYSIVELMDQISGAKPVINIIINPVLIPKRRRRSKEEAAKKGVCISHAMVSAVRPRSFLSPVLIGIAFFIHQKIRNVAVQDVKTLNHIPRDALVPSLPDTLWMCGKWLSGQTTPKMPEIPEWKGFMYLVCEPINFEKITVVPHPFINSPPSDDDTLYTGLRYVAKDATHFYTKRTTRNYEHNSDPRKNGLQKKSAEIPPSTMFKRRVWSDMAIEQTLMFVMKSKGGQTRGIGLSDSVLWVGGAHTATAIFLSLEVFAGVHFTSGEQHVDFRASRINRNYYNRGKLTQWLADHTHFPVRDYTMSLLTRVIGKSNINCHKTKKIGSCTTGTFVGTNFADIKQSKTNSVVPLAAMSNTIKVNNETLVVDPLMIFQRTLINKERDEDVADLLNMLATVQKENFLANEKKTKPIEFLAETLTARTIEASTAKGDADDSIPGRGNIEDKVYSTRQLQELPFSGSILFVHSFTGRDTICETFNKSKLSILKCFLKLPNETKAIADIFSDPTSTPDAVAQAGYETFLTLYQARQSECDLNNNRHNCFVKSSTKVKSNLASLPPTKGAAKQHSPECIYRHNNGLTTTLSIQNIGGWARYDGGVLNTAKTTAPIAPDSILNSIICRCATGYGG
ncbi:hypothetical protein PR048_013163 [Dryococelus australis]|uniref:Uncharacterized protein n=1 Tax=Dryococelus australis TaxID=614101 RepID=A0ABQ9HRE8_9NEOP|nr:hypothetical protein PR048_013163 [Dryococelus australis]